MSLHTYRLPRNRALLLRQAVLLIIDAAVLVAAAVLALALRYEFDFADPIMQQYMANVMRLLPLTLACSLLIFHIFGLYSSIWAFVGEKELVRAAFACLLSSVLWTALQFVFRLPVPKSFAYAHFLIIFVLVVVERFSYRVLRRVRAYRTAAGQIRRRTLVIGAGEAGAVIVRELQQSPHSTGHVVCVVDDNPLKLGRTLYGVKVVGTLAQINEIVEKYKIEDIILAIPSMPMQKQKEVLNRCSETGCQLKTLPGIFQLVNGEVSIQKIRKVEIEDLLARDSVTVNMDEIMGYVSDKVVLVTGGGGSIGSELCRQIAAHKPRRLIIFDIYENNAYAIQQELKRKYPELNLTVLIGSVRDKQRVDDLFSAYRPQIIYHAAAHKHVPLMEDSPNESIKNNVFGTKNVADAADRFGAETFILISTDKAVNPTNIMGASKRICEMIVCSYAASSETKFACVRFGNVLGSNGSVIPLFRQQIEAGGPVTVTHKDIIRYFMTIPEAVSLVLQAGAYAKDGEIFVLDMGKPVRIDDLARNMITLSGLKPDVDIAIEYTGLRPGEKLYEELLLSAEGLEKTPNNLIFIGRLESIDREVLEEHLSRLWEASQRNSDEIRDVVKALVDTYREPVAQ